MATLLQKSQEILTEKNTKILAGNIKSGVQVFDIEGTLVELKGETKTITPSKSQQIITPSSGKNGITRVTVNAVTNAIDSNIIAGNIKKDVTILGVTGTLEATASKTLTPKQVYDSVVSLYDLYKSSGWNAMTNIYNNSNDKITINYCIVKPYNTSLPGDYYTYFVFTPKETINIKSNGSFGVNICYNDGYNPIFTSDAVDIFKMYYESSNGAYFENFLFDNDIIEHPGLDPEFDMPEYYPEVLVKDRPYVIGMPANSVTWIGTRKQ